MYDSQNNQKPKKIFHALSTRFYQKFIFLARSRGFICLCLSSMFCLLLYRNCGAFAFFITVSRFIIYLPKLPKP